MRLLVPFGAWLPSRTTLLRVAALCIVVWFWQNRERPLQTVDRDRGLVLTAERIAERVGGFHHEPGAETLTKLALFGGGERLNYEYVPRDPLAPTLRVVTRVFEGEQGARDRFALSPLRTTLDWKLDGAAGVVGLVRLDGDRPWADESFVYEVQRDGEHVGYDLSARVGTKVISVHLQNILLEDEAHTLERLMSPVFRCLREY